MNVNVSDRKCFLQRSYHYCYSYRESLVQSLQSLDNIFRSEFDYDQVSSVCDIQSLHLRYPVGRKMFISGKTEKKTDGFFVISFGVC